MRSIRRAALAGATAATLLLGGITVAGADESTPTTTKDTTNTKTEDNGSAGKLGSSDKDKTDKSDTSKKDGKKTGEESGSSEKIGQLSSKIGKKLDADQPANGARLWGSSNDRDKEPKWARYMQIVTIVGVVGSVLGLVIFPAYNFLLANHLLPGMPPR